MSAIVQILPVSDAIADAVAEAFALQAPEVIQGPFSRVSPDSSPAMRLAQAMLEAGALGLAAVGDMVVGVRDSADPEKAAETYAEDFKAEYSNRQVNPEAKGAKAVRAARTSDLRAIFKAAIQLPKDFDAAVQAGIDSGSVVGLQSMAKLARALLKPAKQAAVTEGSEGSDEILNESAEKSPKSILAILLQNAINAAVDANELDIASELRAILTRLQ